MRRTTKKKGKLGTVIVTVLSTSLILSGSFLGFLYQGHYHIAKEKSTSKAVKVKNGKQVIYPTIYIGGSGGTPNSLDGLIKQVAPKYYPQSRGLSFGVDIGENNRLKISGVIAKDNHFPQIDFGTVKGTVYGEYYSKALQKMVEYLTAHYQVPYLNLVGFSSGGTGAVYYMMDTGGNPAFPSIKKFVSLDGEYNNLQSLQENETLEGILANGPAHQTLMYQKIAKAYQKISPQTKMLFLMGDYKAKKGTDGTVPWADGLSIYHLFKENGNPIAWTIYSTKMVHALDKENPIALKSIKAFLAEK